MRFSAAQKSFNRITTLFLIWSLGVKSNVMVTLAIIPLLVVVLSATVITIRVVTIVNDVFPFIIISPGPVPHQNTLKHAKNVTVMDWPIAVFMILVLVTVDVSTVNVILMDTFAKNVNLDFIVTHTRMSASHAAVIKTVLETLSVISMVNASVTMVSKAKNVTDANPNFSILPVGDANHVTATSQAHWITRPLVIQSAASVLVKQMLLVKNVNNVKLDLWVLRIHMVKLLQILTIHLVAFLAFVSVTQIHARLHHTWSKECSVNSSVTLIFRVVIQNLRVRISAFRIKLRFMVLPLKNLNSIKK